MTDLADQALTAIQESIAARTVIVTSENHSVEHGSGVAVTFRGKKFIVTAAHVIEPQSDSQIRLIGRPEGPLRFTDKQDITKAVKNGTLFSGRPSQPVQVPIATRILGKSGEDIAALEITETHERLPLTAFHELSPPDASAFSPGRDVVVFGFPGEIAQQVEHRTTGQRGAVGIPYVDRVCVRDLSRAPNVLDPSKYFVTESTLSSNAGCSPKGMSGCGCWYIPRSAPDRVWSPTNMHLLGIQSAHYKNSQLLVLVRVERVIEMLSALY